MFHSVLKLAKNQLLISTRNYSTRNNKLYIYEKKVATKIKNYLVQGHIFVEFSESYVITFSKEKTNFRKKRINKGQKLLYKKAKILKTMELGLKKM